jgi:hypothetical protein
VPLKVINQKSVFLSVMVYSYLSVGQLQQLGDELIRVKVQSTQMSDKRDVDVDMVMPSTLRALVKCFPSWQITGQAATHVEFLISLTTLCQSLLRA